MTNSSTRRRSASSTSIEQPTKKAKSTQDSKAKRVRTGCLTCRSRHLKCDEGLPECSNCLKSNRPCERGVRVNFQTVQTAIHFSDTEPALLRPTADWVVAFQDESRYIAGEYVGGLEKYGPEEIDAGPTDRASFFAEMPTMPQKNTSHPSSMAHQPLPPIDSRPEPFPEERQSSAYEHQQQRASSHHHTHSHTGSSYAGSNVPGSSYGVPERSVSPREDILEFLDEPEEVLFMQVYVEEVGIWMDSMDPMKHFSRLLPFHSLSEPMLRYAFLACGARHLALVNTKYSEDKALHYYNTATSYLLEALQNPNRNTVICATTAVILNVYEIMCERALQRMNHIAGARALIKECGWNARSTGIGAACFWLNVGMELLSCLHFNWQVAWDPDEWGLDMDMSRETESGREEIWTYRIVYIVAKVANFRATIPRTQDVSPQNEQTRFQKRYEQYKQLRELADAWNENIPRTMHPMAYLAPGRTLSGSAFPEVWMIKRTSIVARLFYHTCMCVLAQVNPAMGPEQPEMYSLQQQHSQLICGISAHVKDRGVASVALRSLAIAAECLTTRREQEEVLQIFDKIRQETGWRVGFLNTELKQKWGWNTEQQPQEQPAAAVHVHNGNNGFQQQAQQVPVTYQQAAPPVSLPPAPPPAPYQRPPPGILNPLLASADFNNAKHPYQSHYVAPNPTYQAPNPLSYYSTYYQQH